MHFDAVRVDGDDGRRLAGLMGTITAGDPGPIVVESTGRRGVYFYLPVGTSGRRGWPPGVTRFNAGPGCLSYVPVPALSGDTGPLSWCFPPTAPGRFVHPLLLLNTATGLFHDLEAACLTPVGFRLGR